MMNVTEDEFGVMDLATSAPRRNRERILGVAVRSLFLITIQISARLLFQLPQGGLPMAKRE
jgi:hypothetical protein